MRSRLAVREAPPRGGGASREAQSPRSNPQAGVLQAGSHWPLPRSL